MSHELPLRKPAARPTGRPPFEASAGARLAAALASVVVTLVLVGAVLLGLTDEANGPVLARAAHALAQA